MSENTPRYRPSSGWIARKQCDLAAQDGVTTAIIEAASVALGCTPLDLTPIAETIDTDALEAIIRTGNTDCVVQFTYEGLDVRVDGSGNVSVGR